MLTRRRMLSSSVAGVGAGIVPLGSVISAPVVGPRAGLDFNFIDPGVRPGDDFYAYANGGWSRTAVIPADQSTVSLLSPMSDQVLDRVHGLLEEAATSPRSADQRKVGDLYTSLLDAGRIEALGMSPVAADLRRIDSVASPGALARECARLSTDQCRDLWAGRTAFGPVSSLRYWNVSDPTRYEAGLVQGGLGLPSREYYLADVPAFAKARSAYKTYLVTLFTLAARVDPAGSADRVYALEERLARSQRPSVELADLEKHHNIWTRADLKARAPGLDWDSFLAALGYDNFPSYLVADPDAAVGFSAAAREAPMQDWRDYLAARTLDAFAPYGPKAFADAQFAFSDKALRGVPQAPPRWKKAAHAVDLAMGPAVGVAYMSRYFPPAAQARARAMVANIKAAMAARLAAADWMSPSARKVAQAKLAALRVEVGGEARPRDYSGLQIGRNDAYRNMIRAANWEHRRTTALIDQPVDRGEWDLLPHLVNAQSNPILVKIMFPAGIMQAPMFDAEMDPAVNYGRMGAFIGHEICHIFDATGAKFDEHGAMRSWWTAADQAHFSAATSILVDQYAQYEPLPGVHINAKMTLNENIADAMGMMIAHDAYRRSLDGRPAPVLSGLTGDQRFFIAFASMWRTKDREDALRRSLATSGHAPGPWRAATVRNSDAWYAAFAVKPTDRMWLAPEKRFRLW